MILAGKVKPGEITLVGCQGLPVHAKDTGSGSYHVTVKEDPTTCSATITIPEGIEYYKTLNFDIWDDTYDPSVDRTHKHFLFSASKDYEVKNPPLPVDEGAGRTTKPPR